MNQKTIKQQANKINEGILSIDRLYEDYAKSVGLTYMSLAVLEIIYENPENCTQKFICEQTYNTKQSVNMIIKSFWEQGFVILTELPTDRRNKLVRLSKKGQDYADKIVGTLSNININAMETLTFEQREYLLKLVGIYVKNFRIGITDFINCKPKE